MGVFSFRAECRGDIHNFVTACGQARIVITSAVLAGTDDADATLEFESMVDLETLREVLRGVDDGHVMLETMRACPLAVNSLERDASAWG